LNDPLVPMPLGLGSWFNAVFGVMARDYRRGVAFASIPAGVLAVGAVAFVAATPSDATIDRRTAEANRLAQATGVERDAWSELWQFFGPMLVVVVVGTVALMLAFAFYLAGALHLAAQAADGRPSTAARAVAFARPRVLPLVGWYLLTNLVVIITIGLAALPGALAGIEILAAAGAFLWLPVVCTLMATFGAVMLGVVVVERRGPRRAIGLLRNRFWPTVGRLVIALLLYLSWGGVMNAAAFPFMKAMEAGSLGVVLVLGTVIQCALLVPVFMFFSAVGLVTYAELRHREDPSITTAALAAELTH
jgi:sterol desaturase/sphingolipid hydroxylase (fatty acid hydroxylase superfamily)